MLVCYDHLRSLSKGFIIMHVFMVERDLSGTTLSDLNSYKAAGSTPANFSRNIFSVAWENSVNTKGCIDASTFR